MNPDLIAAEACTALGANDLTLEAYPNRDVSLGGLNVSRALPIREKRMVGPWCFLDRYGPLSFTGDKAMDVATHPHTGLQTVTWLLDGEVLHDDSLGSETVARPGGVNIMTAGLGIAHSEQTPQKNSGRLNGAQLWVALPDSQRFRGASFEGIAEVPKAEKKGGLIQVFAGSLEGLKSPGTFYSDILGAELKVHPGESLEIPLNPAYEHALLLMDGDCVLEGQALAEHTMYYLGTKRASACFASTVGGTLLFIGGVPFQETILMWWNFVARTPEEIAKAREDWEGHRRFGEVRAYKGPRIPAPELHRLSRPNPMS